MKIQTYFIDAFANQIFRGNPAAVCILEKWLSDEMLQSIAAENHLPATAFLVNKANKFEIRWFTPEYEIDLCGHGTLAASYVIFNYLDSTLQQIDFHSCQGLLRVKRDKECITLDFPIKSLEDCSHSPQIENGLDASPIISYQYKSERCLVVLGSEEEVKNIKPNLQALAELPYRGIIITAPGRKADFVSRVFYPQKLISEDAVTGSSHCLLVPYWSKKLSKTKLHSRQLSQRGGDLFCELINDRVFISGSAVLYLQGTISFIE
jgi:PhzF family phenazine biosynthesis protein